MRSAFVLACLLATALRAAAPVRVPGLEKQVEILRDKWGVPHIYASTEHDLFFSQAYITAQDRLFQIDLWRPPGTVNLAEVPRPSPVERLTLPPPVTFPAHQMAA